MEIFFSNSTQSIWHHWWKWNFFLLMKMDYDIHLNLWFRSMNWILSSQMIMSSCQNQHTIKNTCVKCHNLLSNVTALKAVSTFLKYFHINREYIQTFSFFICYIHRRRFHRLRPAQRKITAFLRRNFKKVEVKHYKRWKPFINLAENAFDIFKSFLN